MSHTYPAGWNVVSVPVTPTNLDPATVFDEVPAPRRLYDYRQGLFAAAGEAGFRNFMPASGSAGAAGYWLLFPSATTVSVTGNEPSRTVPYHTSIEPGWNVVGTPWRSSVPWDDSRILVSDGATTKVLTDAVSAGWTDGKVRTWNDSVPPDGAYVDVLPNAGGYLPPWFGFELYSTIAGELIFAPPPPDTTPPVVDIESPAELPPPVPPALPTWPGDAHEVRKLTSVLGKVEDENIASWVLTFRSLETNATITLATGDTEVPSGGFLGNLDPTLQLNGMGVLRLTAVDVNGLQAVPDEELVVIGGDNKLGNFRLTFIDLEVPVAGIPITVRRTYDTRRRGANLDFGYGWQLEVFAAGRYLINRDPGDGWEFSGGSWGCDDVAPSKNHVMEIRFSDREFYRFALDAKTPPGGSADCLAKGKFWQVGGLPGAKLEDNNYPLTQYPTGVPLISDGGDQLLEEFDPGSAYMPRDVRLTTLDGREFHLMFVAGSDGQGVSRPKGLYKIEDRNGNVLELIGNGQVKWSNRNQPGIAKTIQINRTAGRVTSVVDPAGSAISYAYDAAGNLTAGTDRTSNTTNFVYDTSHFLTAIKDPLQNFPIQPAFDAAGRLTAWRDADGNSTTLQTDVVNNSITVTNRESETSGYFYGDDGYLREDIQPGNVKTTFLYDVRGNVTRETDPLNYVTSYAYNSETNKLTKVTDPLNQSTQYFYEAKGSVTRVVQPLGNESQSLYDSNGNLTRETDPMGRVRDYTYNAFGLLATETVMRDPTQPATCVASSLYDTWGNLTRRVDAQGGVADYLYDVNHRQTKQTVYRTLAPGQPQAAESTAMFYDAQGRLTKRSDALDHSTTFEYDSAGQLTREVDPLLHATTFIYDPRNNLTKRVDPDGNFEVSVYDLEGRRTTSLDRAGRLTSYFYDGLGRLTRTEHPDLAREDSFYDAAGRLTKTRNPRGFERRMEYDELGRMTSTMDAQLPPGITVNAYDANGRLTKVTDPDNHATSFFYDAASRRTKTVFDDGTSQAMLYDEAGRLTRQVDQNGKTTEFAYDCGGRLAAVTTPMNHTWSYAYDEVGNLTAQTDANNHITQMRYDALRRLQVRILPMNQADSRTYDAVGNLETRSDFNGKTTTYFYDDLNRLTKKVYQPGNGTTADVSFTYTLNGRRATMVDGVGTTTYEYDDRDRLTKVADPYSRAITYGYDLSGNRTSVVTPATTTGHAYDQVNRLTSVIDSSGSYTYTYTPGGFKLAMNYPNGVTASFTPDNLNRVKVITHTKSTGELIAGFTYTLDNAGNRTAVDEVGASGTRHVAWAYDDEYKLTSENATGADTLAIGFVYDNVGNRLTRTDGLATTQSFEYDANDRISKLNGLQFLYDANGNTLADQGTSYTWDMEDRLLSASGGGHVLSNSYDGDGVRIGSVVDGAATQYVIDPNSVYYRVVEEHNVTTGALDVAYTYGDALIKQTSGPSFFLGDAIGSTRALTDVSEGVAAAYRYESFGALLGPSGLQDTNYLFAGEERAPHFDLYNLRARWYTPANGRLASRDPENGDAREPLSLSPYGYAQLRPTTLGDPTGRFTQWIGYQVEREVCKVYRDDYDPTPTKTDPNITCGRWTRLWDPFVSPGLSADVFTLKPDILDKNRYTNPSQQIGGIWMEVKPYSISGISAGNAAYAKYFPLIWWGFYADTTWSPHGNGTTVGWVQPPLMGGKRFGIINDTGILFYHDLTEDLKDAFLVTALMKLALMNVKTALKSQVGELGLAARGLLTAQKAAVAQGRQIQMTTGLVNPVVP